MLRRGTTSLLEYGPCSSDPLGDYLRSLDRLTELPAEVVLPGHGRPYGDLRAAIVNARQGQQRLLDATLAVLDRHGSTAYQVSNRLGWPANSSASTFEVLIMLGMRHAIAYPDGLVGRGAVAVELEGGRLLYRRVAPVSASPS